MFRFMMPHYHVERVEELTAERLRQIGLNALLVDVDCTLRRYRCEELEPAVADWISGLKREGIGFCLASNGGRHRVRPLAECLDVPFVARALKPLPYFLTRMARHLAFPPRSTAMVGDQVFADVIAGVLAGMRTILVTPLHPEDEPWPTRMKRPLEHWLCRRVPLYDWGAAQPVEPVAAAVKSAVEAAVEKSIEPPVDRPPPLGPVDYA